MANNLNQLIQPRRSFGFAGQEGILFDDANQLPQQNSLAQLTANNQYPQPRNALAQKPITNQSIQQQGQPQNFMQRSDGQRIDLGQSRELPSYSMKNPIISFGKKAYLQPDGVTLITPDDNGSYSVSTRMSHEQWADRRAQEDAALKRRMMMAQVQQEENRAKGIGLENKAPSGYKFTPDGNLEPIPGGPADYKRQMQDAQKAQATEQASLTSQQVIDQAAALLQHPGRKAATGATYMLGNIPGTDAKGFSSQLETFKAQTFIPMVSALKGMGALSDAEGKKLAASVGALDPAMPEAEFESSLKNVLDTLYKKGKAAGLNVSNPLGEQGTVQPAASFEADKEARYQAWKAQQGR